MSLLLLRLPPGRFCKDNTLLTGDVLGGKLRRLTIGEWCCATRCRESR